LQSVFRMRQILVNQSVSFGLTSDVCDSIASGVLNGLFSNNLFKNLFATEVAITEKAIDEALKPLDLDKALDATIRLSLAELNKVNGSKKLITPRMLTLEFSSIFKKEFKLYIGSVSGSGSESVWRYFAVNQAHVEQEKNWLAGIQKMKEVIEKPIRMALIDPTLSKEEQDFLFEKFSDFLIETTETSPFKKFISGGRYVDSQKAIDIEVRRYEKYLERLNSFPSSRGCLKVLENMNNIYNKKEHNFIDLKVCISSTLRKCVNKEDIPPLIFTGNADYNQELEQQAEAEIEVEHEKTVETTVQKQVETAVEDYVLQRKAYTPLVSNLPNSTEMDLSQFFLSANNPPIKAMSDLLPRDISKIFKNLNSIRCSQNLFIDGATLGTDEHGQYHLPGRYLLVVSDPSNLPSPSYMLVSHKDAGLIKDAIIQQSDIKPPRTLSLVSFDGGISASTDLNITKQVISQPEFEKIAVLAKIFTAKTSYSNNEIGILDKMLEETGAPLFNAQKLNELLHSIFRYLPKAAKQYGISALHRLLLNKMNREIVPE
ncbi:MAG: hypothetical protein H0X29_02920, partial [Parachlamydiaceae bacterium]|nr:hypothetical protein [Parachlamydiaceae bacterium]